MKIKNLTPKETQNIVNLYEIDKLSTPDISKKIGYCPSTIYNILKSQNVKFRDKTDCHKWYEIDNNYFSIIDTEEKAYFLGFLYADGYLNDNKGTTTLQLHKDDMEILIKLNKCIKSTRPLLFVNCSKYNEKYGKNNSDAYRLVITNQVIFKDLKKLGLFQKKSLTLKFPNESQVPNNLIRHFIRGYFDGDGNLTGYFPSRGKGKHFQCGIAILSTIEFVTKLCDFSKTEVGISTCITKRFKDETNNYNFVISGNLNIVKFLEWIYKDSNIFLKRKYNKLVKILNIIKGRKLHKSRTFINNSKYLSLISS